MNQNRAVARYMARENIRKEGHRKSDHKDWSTFFHNNWRKFAKGGKK